MNQKTFFIALITTIANGPPYEYCNSFESFGSTLDWITDNRQKVQQLISEEQARSWKPIWVRECLVSMDNHLKDLEERIKKEFLEKVK